MGSCFSDMEGGKQAIRCPRNRDGHTYDDAFQLILPTRVADTRPLPSAPAPPMLPEDQEAEEELQIAIAIMVSLEPELEKGTIPQLSFWQNQPTTGDSSSSSTPLQRRRQATRSQTSLSTSAHHVPPECEYCYEAPIEATCDPCGHVACFNCWLKIQDSDNKCPRCRVVINKIIRLYM